MPRYEYDSDGNAVAFFLGNGPNEKRIPVLRQERDIDIRIVLAIVAALRRRRSGRRGERLFSQVRPQDVLEVFTGIRPANAEPLTLAIREELDARGLG